MSHYKLKSLRAWVPLLAAVVVVSTVLPILSHRRRAAWRLRALGCLSQARVVLANYEADIGTLPPLCLRDNDGTPLLSWRALLLPQLEGGQNVFDSLDITARWDGPTNHEVIATASDSLSKYFSQEGVPGRACVLALVGDQSLWDSASGIARGTIQDNPDLLYVPSSSVSLLEPVEVTEHELRQMLQDGREAFFITAGGKYGDVRFSDGRLDFSLNWKL